MQVSVWSLLIAGVLPVVCAGIAKAGMRGYDNHNPREWMQRLSGYRARANAAQANSLEAFPFFAAGVLLALHLKVAPGTVDALALTFVLARVAYIACYVADKAALRSLVWFVGYAATVALYVVSARV